MQRMDARWLAALAVVLCLSLGVVATSRADDPAPGILISEVMYRSGEWIELYNGSGAELDLVGWKLLTPQGEQTLAGVLPPGGFAIITVERGLPDSGGSLQVLKPSGEAAAAMSYGTDSSECPHPASASVGASLQLAGADSALCSYASAPPSPMAWPPPNPADTPVPGATATAVPGAVAITEVSYRGGCELEWIELANVSSSAVTLANWSLADNHVAVPLNLVLAPGELVVLRGANGTVSLACPVLSLGAVNACLGDGLADDGDFVELLDASGRVIDGLSFGDALVVPSGMTLARAVTVSGALSAWAAASPSPGCLLSVGAVAPTPEPTEPTASATPPSDPDDQTPSWLPEHSAFLPVSWMLRRDPSRLGIGISEVLYDGTTEDEGDEFVELYNYGVTAISLDGYLLGDAEVQGDGEGMYAFPPLGQVPVESGIVIARCAASHQQRFGVLPDYEMALGACPDHTQVPNLVRVTAWGKGSFSLANGGDEVLLLGADYHLVDSVAFGGGDFAAARLDGDAHASEPLSLQRLGGLDNDDMSLDFSRESPTPGLPLRLPGKVTAPPGPNWAGFTAYWGNLHAHSSLSDGAGPPELAFARARAAGLHFYAISDHDTMLRPLEWDRLRYSAADAAEEGAFVALAAFEWTHRSEGHINIFGSPALVSSASGPAATRAGLLDWLGARPLAIAQFNHPGLGGSFGGAEIAPANAEPWLLEVGNGSSQSGSARLFEEQLFEAWSNGWRAVPTFGADTHDAFWGSDTQARTGVWATTLTEGAVLDALRAGRVFATEDADLAVAWRCGQTWMGGAAWVEGGCSVYYRDANAEAAVIEVMDAAGGLVLELRPVSGEESTFAWPAGASLLWLRVVQSDGDLAWSAPIWRLLAAPTQPSVSGLSALASGE